MSKVLVIQLQAAPYPGTAYLCGAARSAGHSFVLHLFSNHAAALGAVRAEQPDLVGFSCMTGIHSDAIEVARRIKAVFPSLPIIMGGPHPTFFPEVIQDPAIDMVCRGEGEYALVELLNALQDGSQAGLAKASTIANLHVKISGNVVKNPPRPLADPMDDLPMIDWTCYQGTDVLQSAPVVFPVRGCPYGCTYCFNAQYRRLYQGLGKPVRMFSPERAAQETVAALQVFARSPVLFNSDTVGTDPEWLEAFLKRYEQVTDLPFVVLLRPELATQRVVDLLARSRCHAVAIGVESGSARVRKQLMRRLYSDETLLRVADSLHRAGIRFRSYNMLGLPSETEEELWETIDLNVRMGTDFPRGAIFTPMPGTQLAATAKAMGYLDESFSFDDIPKTILAESVLQGIDRDRLRNYLHLFQTAIVFPWSRPLIKRLVRVKPNPLYTLWFYLVYTHLHRKSEGRGIVSYVRYVLANRRYR